MDVDQSQQVQIPYGMASDEVEGMNNLLGMGIYGMAGGEGFDASQAGLLQQQVGPNRRRPRER